MPSPYTITVIRLGEGGTTGQAYVINLSERSVREYEDDALADYLGGLVVRAMRKMEAEPVANP